MPSYSSIWATGCPSPTLAPFRDLVRIDDFWKSSCITRNGMNVGDWIGAAADAAQVLAIVVGGLWAYSKFVRGRIFARRAELSVSAQLLSGVEPQISPNWKCWMPSYSGSGRKSNTAHAICARITLKNTGASQIPLRVKALRVYAPDEDAWPNLNWERLETVLVFDAHGWLEAQEVICDDVLVPIARGDTPSLAYRLEFVVIGKERRIRINRRSSMTKWTTETIVPSELLAKSQT